MRIVPASDSALCVSFGESISPDLQRQVIALFHGLQRLQDPRIRNLHPAYSSLLIDFDSLRLPHAELEEIVVRVLGEPVSQDSNAARLVEIPVCYETEFAPDLADVAQHCGLTEEQAIATHSAGDYFVYFLGFAPGFGYLGGLPRKLHVSRLATPRKHVSAGSVGLAGEQTGIYPNDSPGGWRLIGRTPLRMFDPAADLPSRLQPGDRVRFRRISRADFDHFVPQEGGR
jgi:KipI family sensor histidine kinase inhibitor